MFPPPAPALASKVRIATGLSGSARPAIQISGDVDHDHLASFTRLGGQRITCHSGRLWVTMENIPGDYQLEPRERLAVPTDGKVVIGGTGRYSI